MGNKIFLDTNCIVDILQKRTPNYTYVVEILKSENPGNVSISALTVANANYITKPANIKAFQELVSGFQIVPLDKTIIRKAFNKNLKDFEDSLQLVSAESVKSKFLLTWNDKDYKGANTFVEIITPKNYCDTLLSHWPV